MADAYYYLSVYHIIVQLSDNGVISKCMQVHSRFGKNVE